MTQAEMTMADSKYAARCVYALEREYETCFDGDRRNTIEYELKAWLHARTIRAVISSLPNVKLIPQPH